MTDAEFLVLLQAARGAIVALVAGELLSNATLPPNDATFQAAMDTAGKIADAAGLGGGIIDRPKPGPTPTPPAFTVAPRAFGVGPTVAGVEWQTDQRTSGRVDVVGPGYAATVHDRSRQRDHQRTIEGLSPGTTYQATVTAITSQGGEAAAAPLAITTAGAAPSPGPGPAPGPGDLPHQTDFLAAGARTHTYAGRPPAERADILRRMTVRRYTHLYVYAYNERDYGGPAFDGYAHPLEFRQRLEEIAAAGLKPVVWCFPDDAPAIHGETAAALAARLSRLVPAIDDLVSSYVLGLELDEYWDPARVDALGRHLRALTQKPIATHQLNGRCEFARFAWADFCVYQYADRSPAGIERETRAALAKVGKPVVAGEYEVDDEARAVRLGDLAVRAGAAGFGNGGTPAAVPGDAPHGPETLNLLAGAAPWVPGSLTRVDPAWADRVARVCRAGPTTLVIADMDAVPAAMRAAGFRGRDTALWYTLSRSYAEWPWRFDPADADAHLSGQRPQLRDFWGHYLAAVAAAMQAAPATRALLLQHDGHDKCGDVLAEYSLRNELRAVTGRVERGHVHQGVAGESIWDPDTA